jgi:hypothetical protein
MGRIKKNRGRRDGSGKLQGLHWTPLQQSCDCVVEWGWNTEKMPPPAFVEWCMSMLVAPCVWHGADTGLEVPAHTRMVAIKSPLGNIYTKRAEGDRRELGLELTRRAEELAGKMRNDVAGVLRDIPPKYRHYMQSKGYDPAETWTEMRLVDIFLNHGRPTLIPEMIEALPDPA